MSSEFSSTLKELMKNRRVTIDELAGILKTSPAIVISWEDGSDSPSRNIIITIGKILKLNTVETDNLLSLAGFEKLSGEEVVNLVNSNLSAAGLIVQENVNISHKELSSFFNSTGTVMGTTIDSLDEKVKSIETSLETVNNSILGLKSSKNPEIMSEIENRMRPLMLEVQAIREEVVPQLETTKTQLSKTDEFLRKNADFFITAVEGEGAIKVVSKEVDSIEKRLSKMEGQINVTRDRMIAIISVVIALISACIACVSLGLFSYTSFVKP
ncbi:MAG: hypothetical protein JNM55_10520 [Anaerolineales bacterium]|nr:hypothetical protein [Anaerolineales bacterium]